MDKETNYAQNSRTEKNRKPMLGKRRTEMKERILIIVFALTLIIMTGCSKETDNMALQGEVSSSPITTLDITEASSALPPSEDSSQPEEKTVSEPVIQISHGKNVVTFQLNDSKAAKELYEQLPLSLAVQNYSNNEKIFYPPEALDTNNAIEASGQEGSLAYYELWGNVVMFYRPFTPSPSGRLYELGKAVSDSEHIQNLSGTIEINRG